jgi:hypothetical protein
MDTLNAISGSKNREPSQMVKGRQPEASARSPQNLALRQQLQSDQFQLLGRFPVLSNEPAWKDENLLLYENKQWTPQTEKEMRI